MPENIQGTDKRDIVFLGTGAQTVTMGAGRDRIISYADGGEPDPAQTNGADGRVYPAVPPEQAIDILTGGAGADIFELRGLLNAKQEILDKHTKENGAVNWGNVAGENDNVHDHWVESFGLDIITDYSEAEGDKIIIKGHTVTVAEITYDSDDQGSFSLIRLISQQGNGGAAGANTATGAHDEDELGHLKVYGDQVTLDDLTLVNNTQGVDRLNHVDQTYGNAEWGITQEVFSATDGTSYTGILGKQKDKVHLGEGSQTVHTGGGNDTIFSYSDGGEPDPAQGGARINPAVANGAADDIISGGQGKDTFAFRLLLNATDDVMAKHTRADGSIKWKKVAGENDNVHDHWVEGIGNDTILDYSKQDGDKIDIRGHTVEIASITYGNDAGGDFSLISLRSQQGAGGGAHDEDLLGTIKVYGDTVTADDITVKSKVFFGIDRLDTIADGEVNALADNIAPAVVQPQWGLDNPETIDQVFVGSSGNDKIKAGSGSQTVYGGDGKDRLISIGDGGEPTPAQGGAAINAGLSVDASDDVFTGGRGADKFEFHALLNGTAQVLAQHTNQKGAINWRKVAGENDNVHDHWVEGWGHDVVTDYSKAEGDQIIVRGHTVQVASIEQGSDADGGYSLIRVISQQGNGGAGGANTATGAHDEDFVGTIKVYGDVVEAGDITVQAAGVFDGMDRLPGVDAQAAENADLGPLPVMPEFAPLPTMEEFIFDHGTFVTQHVLTDGIDSQLGSGRSDFIDGQGGADVIKARGGADIVLGGDGDDRVQGNGGDDILFGEDGNDDLRGGSGDDQILGGAGADFLHGGRGSDEFIFTDPSDSMASAKDRVSGFESGVDLINLSLLNTSFDQLTFTDLGRHLQVSIDSTGFAFDVLRTETLQEEDFIF